jgi:hypothetical protein
MNAYDGASPTVAGEGAGSGPGWFIGSGVRKGETMITVTSTSGPGSRWAIAPASWIRAGSCVRSIRSSIGPEPSMGAGSLPHAG